MAPAKNEAEEHVLPRGKSEAEGHVLPPGKSEAEGHALPPVKSGTQNRPLSQKLTAWFRAGHRDLPWRSDPTPYHVWISEIMLQQTRVEAVKPYYERFLEALPDIPALAHCSDDRLLKLWEGLGYYSRARNLKKAALVVEEQYAGELPADYEELQKLPGIGPYTAGAIASIAFHIPVPAVDGNAVRVMTRLTADRRDIRDPKVTKDIRESLSRMLCEGFTLERPCEQSLEKHYDSCPEEYPVDPGAFNQALMELGAMVCVPSGPPRCDACPLQEDCLARDEGLTGEIPFKSPPAKRRIEEKTVLVVRDGRYTLLHRREEKGLLAGMYEFPYMDGYRCEKEVLEHLEKELHLNAVQIHPLQEAKHIFSHIEWKMTGYMVLVEDLGILREHTGELPGRHTGENPGELPGSHGGELPGENPVELPGKHTNRYFVVEPAQTRREFPIPAAYRAYASALQINIGIQKNKQ